MAPKKISSFDLICLVCATFVATQGQQIFKEQVKVLEAGVAFLTYVYFLESV